jgi:DNA-binding transcriptional MocR family regulator
MKRLYAARREALLRCLREEAADVIDVQATAGMAVVTRCATTLRMSTSRCAPCRSASRRRRYRRGTCMRPSRAACCWA